MCNTHQVFHNYAQRHAAGMLNQGGAWLDVVLLFTLGLFLHEYWIYV